jgi:hypothetical protein
LLCAHSLKLPRSPKMAIQIASALVVFHKRVKEER